MSNIAYHKISGGSGLDNVVAFNPAAERPLYQADSRHPHWNSILEGLERGDPNVFTLFDVKSGLPTVLQELSDRITYYDGMILFDGDPQEGPLADHLTRCLESGVNDYKPVVKFWEKVATNPDKRSREQLFEWLRSHDFTITEEGDILGYKGVVTQAEGEFFSSHSGTAFVDGKEITGQIPNQPGTVVTMPRAKVANDPNVSCHYGLHVGDWSYAHAFTTGPTLEVHVNPRDVVSIPRDSQARKMRTCRYKVVRVRDSKSAKPIEYAEPAWTGNVGYRV